MFIYLIDNVHLSIFFGDKPILRATLNADLINAIRGVTGNRPYGVIRGNVSRRSKDSPAGRHFPVPDGEVCRDSHMVCERRENDGVT